MEYNLLFDHLIKDHQDSIHVKHLSVNGKTISVPALHREVIKDLYGYIKVQGENKDYIWFTLKPNVSMQPTLVGGNAHTAFEVKNQTLNGKNPLVGYVMVADEDASSLGVNPILDVVYTSKLDMIRDLKEREALSRYHGFSNKRILYIDPVKGIISQIKLFYPDGETRTVHLYSFSIQ